MERIFITGLTALFCVVLVSAGKADEIIFERGQERIVHDAQTGEYVIEYIGNDGTLKTVRWTPASNINVSVRSKFKLDNDHIKYRYTIKNHKDSLQPVLAFKILVRNNAKEENMSAPDKWDADLIKNYDNPSLGLWADWTVKRAVFGLSSGESVTGLEIVSKDLPGVGTALIRGLMSVLTYPDEGPGGEMIEFMEQGGFLRKASQGIPRFAAVPKIPVPDPFDPATVLTVLREHVKGEMVDLKQIDPAFVTELLPWFDAAIAAANQGNTKALRHALKELRTRVVSSHKGLDDDTDAFDDPDWDGKRRLTRLAARVLHFDLKYVERRISKD